MLMIPILVISALSFILILCGFSAWNTRPSTHLRLRYENDVVPRAVKKTFTAKEIFPVTNYTARINLLFLVRTKFTHESIWEEWLKQARRWSLNYSSQTGVGLNATDIRITIHHDPSVEQNDLKSKLPQLLRNVSKFAQPVKCKWGHTTPCMHSLLKTAVEDKESNSDYFVFLSQNTIPLQRFSEMAIFMLNNVGKSQFFITDINFPKSPKHHQWIVLARKHAQLLVDRPELWTDESVCQFQSSKVKGQYRGAADDEFCPLFALRKIYQNPAVRKEDINIKKEQEFEYARVQNLWRELNFGVVPPLTEVHGEYTAWNPESKHTFVCWHGNCKIGKGEGAPLSYNTIFPEKFEKELLGTHWFGRKFDENCVVKELKGKDGQTMKIDEYLIEKLFGGDAQ